MSKISEEFSIKYADNKLSIVDKELSETSYHRHTKMGVKIFDGRDIEQAAMDGYEQAENDLTPAFEFSFDVPDNDGHVVFTPMDNMTIRKELKLKKGERVIVSIRKEHEKE